MYRRDTSPSVDHYDDNYDTDIAIWGQFATLEVTHSTSHDNYKPHPIQKPLIPPLLPPKPHIPFQGGSSSHSSHPPLPLPSSPPSLNFLTKPHIPFQGQSTTHQHYCNPLDTYLLSNNHNNHNNHNNNNKATVLLRGRPAVSIALQGGLVRILIPPTDITTTIYPVIGREIFTNTKDDQKQLKFRVYQGWGPRVDQNKILGEFSLYFDDSNGTATSVLRNSVVKAGSMKIQVAIRLLADGSLQAEARDLVKKTSLGWTFTPTPTWS